MSKKKKETKKTTNQKTNINKKVKVVSEEKKVKESTKPDTFINIFIIIILSVLGVVFYLNYHENQLAHNKIINHSLVTSGSGLYTDTLETGIDESKPFTSKYYFRGKDVNNYLVLYNKCFRIINIAQNNALKIMYVGPANNNTCENIEVEKKLVKWDENNKNIWSESSINTYLDNWIKEIRFDESPYVIKDATWYVGGLFFNAQQNLTVDIQNERKPQYDENIIYNGIVGLINVSDYMKATERLCVIGAANDKGECSENNYLSNNPNFWTMNKTLNSSEHVWAVEKTLIPEGNKEIERIFLQSKLTNNDNFEVYPVVYLKANLVLNGHGTAEKPYLVAQ